MASVDELSAAVAAARDAIEQSNAVVEGAKQQAEELSGQLAAMGVEQKSAQAMQVKDSLEQMQAQVAALTSAAEQVQQQAEAIRGLQSGPGGGVPAGGASQSDPTPAGASGGGNDKPPSEPPTPAAGDFEPEDFNFDLFGDEVPDDQIVYTVGEAPPSPNEIDTDELTGKSRLDKMRQGFARNLGDAKENIEKGGFDATGLVADDYDPYPNAVPQSLAPSGPEPVVQAGRVPGEDVSLGALASTALAVTVLGVEVAGKIKDSVVKRKRD